MSCFSDYNWCTECFTGYELTINGECVKLPDFKTDSCGDGRYWNTSTWQCLDCPADCLVCDQGDGSVCLVPRNLRLRLVLETQTDAETGEEQTNIVSTCTKDFTYRNVEEEEQGCYFCDPEFRQCERCADSVNYECATCRDVAPDQASDNVCRDNFICPLESFPVEDAPARLLQEEAPPAPLFESSVEGFTCDVVAENPQCISYNSAGTCVGCRYPWVQSEDGSCACQESLGFYLTGEEGDEDRVCKLCNVDHCASCSDNGNTCDACFNNYKRVLVVPGVVSSGFKCVRLEPSTHFPIIARSTTLNPTTLIFEECSEGCHECFFDEDGDEHCSACADDLWLGFIQREHEGVNKQISVCMCNGLNDKDSNGNCLPPRDFY
jgi:hypothetical protein